MTRRSLYLRIGRRESEGTDTPPEYVPESEADESRRLWREWLRDRESDEFAETEDAA